MFVNITSYETRKQKTFTYKNKTYYYFNCVFLQVIEDRDKPGIYKIIFKPKGPGTYRIFIIYDKRLVKGKVTK